MQRGPAGKKGSKPNIASVAIDWDEENNQVYMEVDAAPAVDEFNEEDATEYADESWTNDDYDPAAVSQGQWDANYDDSWDDANVPDEDDYGQEFNDDSAWGGWGNDGNDDTTNEWVDGQGTVWDFHENFGNADGDYVETIACVAFQCCRSESDHSSWEPLPEETITLLRSTNDQPITPRGSNHTACLSALCIGMIAASVCEPQAEETLVPYGISTNELLVEEEFLITVAGEATQDG